MAQFNKNTQDFLNQERTLFEVNMIANKNGEVVTFDNPFPVSLGSSTITINGDITIPATISVASSEANPVHTHITEVGITSILTTPYLPVGVGTVNLNLSYLPVGISSLLNTVSIGNTVEVSFAPGGTGNIVSLADNWGNKADWRPQFTDNNRLKVSPFQTVFFNTFQYGKETDVWDERVVGVGTATHSTSSSNVIMEVGSNAGSKIIRQTKNVMRYIPGRSATLTFAIRLDNPQVGIRRRFGLFDDNNGAFFEDNGGTYSYVIRSSVTGITTETRVYRDDWNGEKFDGNGWTGVTADPTKHQMISINYEWYGAGIVEFSWLIKNETIASHTFTNSNTNNNAWCSTPFLPIRCEIENITGVAGTHYLYQGSNSLLQEGEPEKLGTLLSFTNPITGTTMPSADTFYPIISLRLKSSELSAVMLLRTLQAATNDNTNIYWRLIENATLTGGTWVDHPDPNSFMQYNITQTAVSGGTTILNGFVVGGSSNLVVIDEKSDLQLGRSGIGTISDTYTIACASPNTNKSALAVLNWIEQR